jgi:hypothetical protein
MSINELEIGWAMTASERRYLQWELLACEEVLGVFFAARDGVLAVLFDGGPREFRDWASAVAPADSRHPQTNQKGASQ